MSKKTASGPLSAGRSRFPKIAVLVLLLNSLLFGWSYSARAGDHELTDGAAVVTTFSGIRTGRNGEGELDRRGIAVRALDLSGPGTEPEGNVITPPELFFARASDVGQVFAVALDEETPASIFVAATSVYGLFRNPGNDGWVPGMWGPGGGPGTIYKLNADAGYAAELFTRVELDGGLIRAPVSAT